MVNIWPFPAVETILDSAMVAVGLNIPGSDGTLAIPNTPRGAFFTIKDDESPLKQRE